MNTHATPAVRVAARRDGFRRAGMAHPAEPVIHPAGTFTMEQLEQLLADPELIVDVDPAPEAAAPAGAGTSPAPDADAHREARILAGVLGVDPANRKLWTKTAGPSTSALAQGAGLESVSSGERDAAWSQVAAFVEAHVAATQPPPAPDAGDEAPKD